MEHLIYTDRTIIRPLQPGDQEGMYLLDSNPNVHRYIGSKPISSREEALNVIGIIRQQYIDFGIGRWAVLQKDTNEFIGWLGFKYIEGPVNKHTNYHDFGYRLREEFWGQGYATESGTAALRYGLDTLKFKDVFAMTDIDNMASRRVLEKLGFRLGEIFPYDAEPNWRAPNAPTTWYEYAPIKESDENK